MEAPDSINGHFDCAHDIWRDFIEGFLNIRIGCPQRCEVSLNFVEFSGKTTERGIAFRSHRLNDLSCTIKEMGQIRFRADQKLNRHNPKSRDIVKIHRLRCQPNLVINLTNASFTGFSQHQRPTRPWALMPILYRKAQHDFYI